MGDRLLRFPGFINYHAPIKKQEYEFSSKNLDRYSKTYLRNFLNKTEYMQSANFSCCQGEGQKFAHTLAITVLFRYMDLVEFMGLFKLSAVDGLFTRC